jgi:hypothetical protein
MKKLTVLALVAIALGAFMHFWPQGDPQPIVPPAPEDVSRRGAAQATAGGPTPLQQPAPTTALSPERVLLSGTVERPPTSAARIGLRAPPMVRSGDNFSVTIDVQALRAIRRLEFALTYEKSVLRLLGSVPGALVQREGTTAQFEESSDGYLFVRIDVENGVIFGAGSVAALEFQALRRGVSPLTVQDVTYVEMGGQGTATTPEVSEGSITVE